MKKVKLTTTINENVLKEFKKLAIDRDCSIGSLIEQLMKEEVEKAEK